VIKITPSGGGSPPWSPRPPPQREVPPNNGYKLHTEPGNEDPIYAEPGNEVPIYAEPGNGEPIYDELGPGTDETIMNLANELKDLKNIVKTIQDELEIHRIPRKSIGQY
jgi:hypothetical protein